MRRDTHDSEKDYDTDNEPVDEGYERGESETGPTTAREGEAASQRARTKSTGRATSTGSKRSGGSSRGKRSTQRSSHRPAR